MLQGIPRWLIAFGIVVIAVIELVARVPDIMLVRQKIEGGAGEYGKQALQPQLTEATIAKTVAEANVANVTAQLNAALEGKAVAEAKVVELSQAKVIADTQLAQTQAQVTQLQGILYTAQAQQAKSQIALNELQGKKVEAETKVQQLTQYLTMAQEQAQRAQAQQSLAQADQARAQAGKARAEETQTTLQNAGTVIGALALLGVGVYAANKLGYLPESSSSTTTASRGYSAVASQTKTATIISVAANIRTCAGTRCDIVNKGDPLSKGTRVVITGDASQDDKSYDWFPVKVGTYSGFVSGAIMAMD